MEPIERFRGWFDRYRDRILPVEKESPDPSTATRKGIAHETAPADCIPSVVFTKHATDRMGQRGISQENVMLIAKYKDFDKPRGKGSSGRPRRGWMIKRLKLNLLEKQKTLSKSDAERLNGVMVISERLSPDHFRVITVQHKQKRHRQ
ncbi:MAG: hypothetical protein ISN28_01970 [Ectothiorhodospiraceae bacterium AqS1]|nr:hypothetical protein [Ectothiorhodospiraceae bacterium AqS1]